MCGIRVVHMNKKTFLVSLLVATSDCRLGLKSNPVKMKSTRRISKLFFHMWDKIRPKFLLDRVNSM